MIRVFDVKTTYFAFACAAILLARPLAERPLLADGPPKSETVIIKLPRIKPSPTWSEAIGVGLYIRPEAESASITGYQMFVVSKDISPDLKAGQFFFYSMPPQFSRPEDGYADIVEIVSIDLSQAFREQILEVVRGLFALTTISQTPTDSRFDIFVRAGINATWQEDREHRIRGLEVVVEIEVIDPTGSNIETIRGVGSAGPQKHIFWSPAARCRSMGEKALAAALDSLVAGVLSSKGLNLHLATLAEKRALPPALEAMASFDDAMALAPNGRLDAGEQARLEVEVVNRGTGPAYDVRLEAESDCPQVKPSGRVAVGTLVAGERKQAELSIAADLSLADAVCRLRLTALEKRGYGSRPLDIEIATLAVRPTKLEIVDISLNDRSGRARGDGDGQPANGETLEALVRVRNAGPGKVPGISVTATAATKLDVEILEPRVTVAGISANQVAEARLLLRLPLTYAATALAVTFEAVDVRGPQVAHAINTPEWRVHLKRPALRARFRVLDGDSVASSGNRDRTVNNGERIEIALTARNEGEAQADQIRLSLAAQDPQLTPQPSALAAGDLPPQAEGTEQRFVLEVPRTLGRERARSEIGLVLTLSQQDFPATRQSLTLPFRFLEPDLGVEIADSLTLVRGVADSLTMQLRNNGDLTAEDVIVEVGTGGRELDILDERGVPGNSRKLVIGVLAADAARQLHIPLLTRQSAAVGAAQLNITVAQRDFPVITRSAELRVTAGDTRVIPVVPSPPEPAAPTLTGNALPAAITFLRYVNGDQLLAEKIDLQFEVQSATEPSEVRLTMNGRVLPLEAGRQTTAGELTVIPYKAQVQLAPGENHFDVVVVSRQGVRSERALSLHRKWQQPRVWVAAIGVGTYADPTIDGLRFPAADARAVHDYFARTFDLPPEQRFLLIDERATLREIKSLLGTRLAAQANNPEDTVVLYFAGHGWAEGGAGSADADRLSKYLLPHDAVLADPYSTALDVDEITNIVRRLVPERVVVILDSCFSGAAGGRSPDRPRDRLRGVVTDEFLDRMGSAGKGRVVLTASGANEVARERDDLGHGVFTYYLLAGLGGDADSNRDGEIDVDELYSFVWQRVTTSTNHKQNPVKRSPQAVGRS